MTDLTATPRAIIEDSLAGILALIQRNMHPEPARDALETRINTLAIAIDANDWIAANDALRMMRLELSALPDRERASALLDFETVRTSVDEIEALDTMETRNLLRFPVARRPRQWAVIVGGAA